MIDALSAIAGSRQPVPAATPAPNAPSAGASPFDQVLSARTGVARADAASALVGTPVAGGGCGCGRIASVATGASGPAASAGSSFAGSSITGSSIAGSAASSSVDLTRLGSPVSPDPSSVRPGDLLQIRSGAGGSTHLAIALSTTRMLTGVDGVFRDAAIDWTRVVLARRP